MRWLNTVPCAGVPTPTTVNPALKGGIKLSASVSLASTSMTLFTLSSSTVIASGLATGTSLMARMVSVMAAGREFVVPSFAPKVKESMPLKFVAGE